jgi:hypothetical protein
MNIFKETRNLLILVAFTSISYASEISQDILKSDQIYVDISLNRLQDKFDEGFDIREAIFDYDRESLDGLWEWAGNYSCGVDIIAFRNASIHGFNADMLKMEGVGLKVTVGIFSKKTAIPLSSDDISKTINKSIVHAIWNSIKLSPIFKNGESYWLSNDIDYLIVHGLTLSHKGYYYKTLKSKNGFEINSDLKLIGDTSTLYAYF